MENLKNLHWPLILGLGALALVRPLMSIAGLMDKLGKPATPLIATAVISVIWILAVGLSRVANPVLTLVMAGLVYGVLSILLSAILSPILTDELQGPVAMPIAIIPILITNAIWGVICGALALAVQRTFHGRRNAS